MIFVVVLSLAALAVADPFTQHEPRQQIDYIQNYNYILPVTPKSQSSSLHSGSIRQGRFNPYFGEMKENYPPLLTTGNLNSEIPKPYMHGNWEKPFLNRNLDYVLPVTSGSLDVENSYPVTSKSLSSSINSDNIRLGRFYPYYEERKENYPSLPYNYKSPARSNYFLKYLLNKPDMISSQPKVDYNSQDIYHIHNVNHHHIIKNVHDFKQKEVIRKINDMDYPNFPYSPMNYDNYMNMHRYYNKGYPKVNKYYGKSMEQEYLQPRNNWGMLDHIKNYLNTNMDYVTPITTQNLGVKYVDPIISKKLDLEYVKPIISNSFGLEHFQPAISKNMDVQYVKPIFKNLNADYITSPVNENLNIDYVEPVVPLRNLDVEYTQPITHPSSDVGFVPEVSSRNLYKTTAVPNYYYNWDREQGTEDIFSSEGRFKRDLNAQVGTNVELKQETHVTDLRQDTVNNVKLSHQAPVMTEHQEVFAHGQIPQEVLRLDVQLNANAERVPIQAKQQHSIQQPIQKQTRDIITQSIVATPQYVYHPYYFNPYLSIQAPLVHRSASYPNYYNVQYPSYHSMYNLLYRK